MAQALSEKLEDTGPAEKKTVASVPQTEQLASTPELSFPKRKQSRVSEAPDRMKDIQCQRSKEINSKGKKIRRVFLCRRTARVKGKSKVIPTSFLKIHGRETFVGAKDRRNKNS